MHEEYPFLCETCGERFEKEEEYEDHVRLMQELSDGTISVEEYENRG